MVELEGVEPSSKQGNHTLSTCLSWPSLSDCDKTQAHQSQSYPLKLHPPVEAPKRLFPIYLHRYTFLIRNNIQKSDVSFSHLVRELSQ